MAGIRELVTYLRYKVDKAGLNQYVKDADKAAEDVNKAVNKIKPPPQVPGGGVLPSKGPNGEKIINIPGQGPGYFKPGPGKTPQFVPVTPGSTSAGTGAAPNFRMPGPEAIAVAEREAQRAKLRQMDAEANAEARAQQQIAMAERQAQRTAMRQRETEQRRQAAEQAREAREEARRARQTARAEAEARRTVNSTGSGLFGGVRGLIGGALGVVGLGFGVHQISHIADEWSTVNARIGLVTDNAKEQKDVLNQVYAIANRTRQEYGETANLIFNMRQATQHAGISMKDTLSAAEAFNQALIVGGGTAANNRRAIYELNHALEVGKLGGMQLRSLRMEAPIFVRELTKQIAGGDADKFNQMAKAGLVTTKVIIDALNKSSGELNRMFLKMPLTIGQATTVAGNMFGKLISDIGQTTGAFTDFAHAIVWITELLINGFRWAADAVGGFGNLAKSVGIILGAMVTQRILAGVWGLVSAFEAGGAAAVIMFAEVWLVVGILAAIALVVEDIYGFINGKDSLFGSWIDAITPFFQWLEKSWHMIEDNIGSALQKCGDWINTYLISPISTAFDWAHKLAVELGLASDKSDNIGKPDDRADRAKKSDGPGWFSRALAGISRTNDVDIAMAGVSDSRRTALTSSATYNTTVNVQTQDNPQAVAAAAARGANQGAQAGQAARGLGNSYPNTEAK